jgi:hypothetical protein
MDVHGHRFSRWNSLDDFNQTANSTRRPMKAQRSLFFSRRMFDQPFHLEPAYIVPGIACHHDKILPWPAVVSESCASLNDTVMLANASIVVHRISNITAQCQSQCQCQCLFFWQRGMSFYCVRLVGISRLTINLYLRFFLATQEKES